MTLSDFMPVLTVEIAWEAGFSTPDADRVWTDVSDRVELADGISIQWGRQDERSVADANQLTLTFDNSGGEFTAGNPDSPFYPYVKLDRPIRVTAAPVDGPESVRFVGYVNEWPTEWNGTAAYSFATISASSRLARLGLVAPLASLVETEYLADSQVVYYPLGEPEGATQAADVSGNSADPLVQVGSGAAVTFGSATGPGTDDLTAATFAGGKYLRGGHIEMPLPWSIEAFFSTTAGGDLVYLEPGGSMAVSLGDGEIVTSGVLGSSSAVNDGATHHVVLTAEAPLGDMTLYLDGVVVDTGSSSLDRTVNGPTWVGHEFDGVIAHVAAYDHVLSADRIAAHAAAGLGGFAGETTDERLERYAAYGGIPAAEVDADAGATTMGHVDTTDKQVADLLRIVEATEGGVLHDERDGTLRLRGRGERYEAASAFTLHMDADHVESDYAPRLDRSQLLNDVTGSNTDGTVTARARDTASEAEYGRAATSVETASENPDEPLNLASWLVHTYAEPKSRVPSLSVHVLGFVDDTTSTITTADLLAADVGTRITVAAHPEQAAEDSVDYFIEGGSEVYGPESVMVTWNLSATDVYDNVLVIDDPVRGEIDAYAIAL